MKLEVRLFAGLKCRNPESPDFGKNEFDMEVPSGTTISDLHGLIKLESNYPLINMVNGLAQKADWVLSPGDRVGIFPPVGGG
ncbi:MAG TPA: MoaD/ThiS family protein [Desulfobacteria bacterium]|nr:MoaD/ThiS family protein [Desulfobacteria bacterium]